MAASFYRYTLVKYNLPLQPLFCTFIAPVLAQMHRKPAYGLINKPQLKKNNKNSLMYFIVGPLSRQYSHRINANRLALI